MIVNQCNKGINKTNIIIYGVVDGLFNKEWRRFFCLSEIALLEIFGL